MSMPTLRCSQGQVGHAYSRRHPGHVYINDSTVSRNLKGALCKLKVYLSCGGDFNTEDLGMFRITFAQPMDHMRE